jgi:predicted HicB family RNase H-like nuclease
MNNNLLSYKGFYGSVNFSAADEVFYGKVEGVHDLVSFEGATVKELKQDFQKAVEDYILFCKKKGNPVQKSLMGSFNIRIKPDIHQRAAIVALQKNISLNHLVQQAIERELSLVEENKESDTSPRSIKRKQPRNSKG